MATIFPLNHEIPIEEKRIAVKLHYEACYRVKFKDKLSDEDVQLLWTKMSALRMNASRHFQLKPGLCDNYFNKEPQS